ncbi:MAG: hypothetical protein AAGA93_10930 [Actinomycetota bacterium]
MIPGSVAIGWKPIASQNGAAASEAPALQVTMEVLAMARSSSGPASALARPLRRCSGWT